MLDCTPLRSQTTLNFSYCYHSPRLRSNAEVDVDEMELLLKLHPNTCKTSPHSSITSAFMLRSKNRGLLLTRYLTSYHICIYVESSISHSLIKTMDVSVDVEVQIYNTSIHHLHRSQSDNYWKFMSRHAYVFQFFFK